MERKSPAPRNPFVAAAKFKKAGAHGKSNKARRRAEKVDLRSDHGIAAVQRAFNPQTKVQLLVVRLSLLALSEECAKTDGRIDAINSVVRQVGRRRDC